MKQSLKQTAATQAAAAMRILETCHGLRLNEEFQSPEPTGSGLFICWRSQIHHLV
ncbi:hypothetical protein [Candidatus Villigracilis affinis]|uniref:hypothetical protein n=1 Tax=Candidatus Villigracilis affinis TaxID=3140682 RepID=UPI002A226644|nr:hypothetical protein [Anaerolineales bacterium]